MKTIRLSNEAHRELDILRARFGFRSFDLLIKHCLKVYRRMKRDLRRAEGRGECHEDTKAQTDGHNGRG